MRKSTDINDIGFSEDAQHYKAFLDGIEVEWCETADEEKGFVICAKKDADNNFIIEDGSIARETLHGVVTLERIEL